jgi:hypothetical protein
VAVTLTVVRDVSTIVLNVGKKFGDSLLQLLKLRCSVLDAVNVHL